MEDVKPNFESWSVISNLEEHFEALNQFDIICTLDEEDDYENENDSVWIKSNPGFTKYHLPTAITGLHQ